MSANKVIVDGETIIDLTQDTATVEDVAKGKTFHLADGTPATGTGTGGGGSGGGVELNIAYGDTPPEDTSKLWVKTSEPSGVIISPNRGYGLADGDENMKVEQVTIKPEALSGHSTAIVGKSAYLFGGYTNGNTNNATTTIYRFDSDTETFTKLATTMPAKTWSMGIASVGNKIYLFGGNGSSGLVDQILCFDTEDETITTLATTLPQKQWVTGASAVGTKIYLFGGSKGSGTTGNLKTILCFDTEDETITTLSTRLPFSSSGVIPWPHIGSKIYFQNSKTVYRFNADEETIDTLSVACPVSADFNGLMGTRNYRFGYSSDSTIYFFDIEKETFGTLSVTLPQAGSGTTIFMDEGRIYFQMFASTVYLFSNSSISVADGVLHIVQKTSGEICQIISTDTACVEIGVHKIYKGNAEGIGEEVEAALYKDGTWTTI